MGLSMENDEQEVKSELKRKPTKKESLLISSTNCVTMKYLSSEAI